MVMSMMIEALTEEVEDLGLTGRDVNEEQDAYTTIIIIIIMIMMLTMMMVLMMIDDHDDSDDDDVEPTYLYKRMPLF